MYSDYQNDIKKFLRMEFLFDPKESIIKSERKVNFFRTDFTVLQQPLSQRQPQWKGPPCSYRRPERNGGVHPPRLGYA